MAFSVHNMHVSKSRMSTFRVNMTFLTKSHPQTVINSSSRYTKNNFLFSSQYIYDCATHIIYHILYKLKHNLIVHN